MKIESTRTERELAYVAQCKSNHRK